MSDTGQEIEVPDELFMIEIIALEADTQGRFSFEVDSSAWFAICTWVNYYKTTAGYRQKDNNGAWKLLEHHNKKVLIK